MNMHRLSIYLILFFVLVQVFSCQKQLEKNADESLEFQTSSDAAVVSEIADCKLRTVTHESTNAPGTPNTQIIGTFVYHPDGLPAELTYKNGNSGNPNYYFIYDNKRRLREMRIGFSRNEPGTGGPWHRYGYDNVDQIIVDSMFNYSDASQTVGTLRTTATFTYDSQKRIVKEVKNWYDGTTVYRVETLDYDYDSHGNLAVEGWASSSYDNNISIFRAHPLFQFIHRNYSKNNATAQAMYNVKGLPLANSPSNDAFFNAFPTHLGGTGITKATYDCDGFVPANEFLYCKLRTITHEIPMDDGPNEIIKGTFVYHPDGLPDNLTYPDYPVGYYFIYDNKRRLRELRYFFSKNVRGWPGSVWHRYGYNSAGQITTDTIVGAFDENESISTFSYDAQGRVSKEDRNYYNQGTIVGTRNDTYKYDSRGNLIVDGWPSSSYDNKVSIYRAHSLFQFIHRNYSKNNASAQTKYNSKGLPLSSKSMNGSFFNPYNGDDRSSSSLVSANYDCP